jgi:hypothetical protein
MKMYAGFGGVASPFLSSALDVSVVSFTPRLFNPREIILRYQLDSRLGGFQESVWTLWRRDKSLAPAGNRTTIVQPVARRYIDWAPAANYMLY